LPATQTLIAETIELCDIADALGRAPSPAREGVHEACGIPAPICRMGDRRRRRYSSHSPERASDFRAGRSRRGDHRLDPGHPLQSAGAPRKRVTSVLMPITEIVLIIVLILLTPFTIAGLSLINTGLGRSRSAAHSLLASLCIFAVAAGVYVVCGFAWQGYSGAPTHTIIVAGKPWNWLGRGPFFLRGMEFNGTSISLAAWLQIFSVGLAALIPLGACLERWRLSAACASTALLAGWTYPLF